MKLGEAEQILDEQIALLIKWNNENINSDPEQVRKNVETIATMLFHKDFRG